jgi:starch phosphorylase
LDRAFWKTTGHNPVRLLKEIAYHQLVACSEDTGYLERYDSAIEGYRNSLSTGKTWFSATYPQHEDKTIAYFSLEFAIHNSLPTYGRIRSAGW